MLRIIEHLAIRAIDEIIDNAKERKKPKTSEPLKESPDVEPVPVDITPPYGTISEINVPDGIYRIQNQGSGLFVSVAEKKTHDGAGAIIQQWLHSDNQVFGIKQRNDGAYAITAIHSEKALEVSGDDYGAPVQQREWCGANRQRWIITYCGDSWYKLVAKHSEDGSHVFDVAGAEYVIGTVLQQAKENGCPAQRFRLIVNFDVVPAGFADITNRWGNKVILIKSIKSGNHIIANSETSFSLQSRNADKSKFETLLTSDGHIVFRDMCSQKYVTASIRERNAPLKAQADDFARWECFRIFTDGKAHYLRSVANGYWVSADMDSQNVPIVSNAPRPRSWEQFKITVLEER
jgi:hypothetical protein